MGAVVREGDVAIGHTDFFDSSVDGTVQGDSCAQAVKNGGKKIANSETIVFFPSHAHAAGPSDFRAHYVKITASGKNRAEGFNVAIDGDVVPVADDAGPDANVQATTNNLNCSA